MKKLLIVLAAISFVPLQLLGLISPLERLVLEAQQESFSKQVMDLQHKWEKLGPDLKEQRQALEQQWLALDRQGNAIWIKMLSPQHLQKLQQNWQQTIKELTAAAKSVVAPKNLAAIQALEQEYSAQVANLQKNSNIPSTGEYLQALKQYLPVISSRDLHKLQENLRQQIRELTAAAAKPATREVRAELRSLETAALSFLPENQLTMIIHAEEYQKSIAEIISNAGSSASSSVGG